MFKKSDGKIAIYDMLIDFNLALIEIAKVTAYGNQIPGRTPGSWWVVTEFEREYNNAKARHMMAGMFDQFDNESKLYHLAHDIWNGLALLQKKLEDKERAIANSGTDGGV